MVEMCSESDVSECRRGTRWPPGRVVREGGGGGTFLHTPGYTPPLPLHGSLPYLCRLSGWPYRAHTTGGVLRVPSYAQYCGMGSPQVHTHPSTTGWVLRVHTHHLVLRDGGGSSGTYSTPSTTGWGPHCTQDTPPYCVWEVPGTPIPYCVCGRYQEPPRSRTTVY